MRKTAPMATATATLRRLGARSTSSVSTISAGATQTQWCDHETGEARSTAVAVASSAVTRSPRERARRIATTATTSMTATAPSHSADSSGSGGANRETTALKDSLAA